MFASESFDFGVDPRHDFYDVRESNKALLKDILAGTAARPSNLVAELYTSGMDEEQKEQHGLQPVQDILEAIDHIQDKRDVVHILARDFHGQGLGIPFNRRVTLRPGFAVNVEPDSKNSSWALLHLSQGGLGLPNRDYYVLEEKAGIREKYAQHLVQVFGLAGCDKEKAQHRANTVMDMETELAKSSLTSVEQRDSHHIYNKKSVAELQALAPHLDWDVYFSLLGLDADLGDVIVENPDFLAVLSLMIQNRSLDDWKAYLTHFALMSAAPYTTRALESVYFDFYKKTLVGQEEPQVLWKRVLEDIGHLLRDELGKLYVERAFPLEAKQQAQEMVALLTSSLRNRIAKLPWMEQQTRDKALAKLAKSQTKIGYPDVWLSYEGLQLSRTQPYLTNVRLASSYEMRRIMKRANKSVDRTLWEMGAFEVNAFYHPQLGEIGFPAGILQPPFFYAPNQDDPHGSVATNFGAIGAIIGHEMTHGYDDQGRQYDADGNLQDWWTETDAAEFKRRAQVIIDQFAGYEVLGRPVNGELTQGENIADLGGVKLAYMALQAWMAQHGRLPNLTVDQHTFTPEQQFFLSYARIYRHNIKDEAALNRLIADPHAPGQYRVLGPLSNMPEFWQAFAVQRGDPMARPEVGLVAIW